MKPVTLAAGMERANLRASSAIHLPAKLTLYDEDFVDPGRYQDTDRSVADILRLSSNIGAIRIAQMAGGEALEDYLLRFHFGSRTGVALPHEEAGLVPARADWSGTSVATLAIGQGITMTPLQLAAAYGAIANGGEWVTPQIVRATVDPDGRHRPMAAPDRQRIIAPETASELRRMLGAVVSDGTGKRAAVPGFDVGGKTGTAWKVQADGSYGSDGNRDYVATFAGMVPVVDPRLVIVVVIDEPARSTYTGGDAAAPVFAAIAQPALRAVGVSPTHGLVGSSENIPPGKVRALAAEADPTVVPKLPAAAVAAATPATIPMAVPIAPPPGTPVPGNPGTTGTTVPGTTVSGSPTTPPVAVPPVAVPPAETPAAPVSGAAAPPADPPAAPPDTAAAPPGAAPAAPPPTSAVPDPNAAPAPLAAAPPPATVAPAAVTTAPATPGGGGG